MNYNGYIVVNNRTGEIEADWLSDPREFWHNRYGETLIENVEPLNDESARELFVEYLNEYNPKDTLSLYRAKFWETKNEGFLMLVREKLS